MKRHKLLSGVVCAVLCFCLSFGSMACVATGLNLSVELWQLALGCLVLAALMATLFSLPKGGWIALGGSGLLLLLLIPSDLFMEQLLGLCLQAVTYYSQAYGFAIPEGLQHAASWDHLLPLLAVAGVICLASAWIIIHRYPSALAIFLATVPLLTCFVVTDTVPDLLFLLLWIFSVLILVMTQSVRIREAEGGNRLTLILSIPLIVGLLILSLVVPESGFTSPVPLDTFENITAFLSRILPSFDIDSDGKLIISFISDLPSSVDLGNISDRYSGTSTALEVTAGHTGRIYLRIRDYDTYTGKNWTSSKREETMSVPDDILIQDYSEIKIRAFGRRSQQLIPYYPIEPPELENGYVAIDTDQQEYSFEMAVLSDYWAYLWRQGYAGYTSQPDSIYLELPQYTANEAQDILRQISDLDDSEDTVAAAELISLFVRNSATYSLDAYQMPSSEKDFAIWFLEDADEGFCVHFATAATVLLRAHGIPARFVEGYTFQAKEGELTKVRQDKAHAWVEYFVDGVGWVVLDPTPGDGESPEPPPTHTTTTTPSPSITIPSIGPSEPDPTEPPSVPTDPSEDPTNPPPKPTDPSEDPSAPPSDPTVPSEDPTGPSEDPDPPSGNSTHSGSAGSPTSSRPPSGKDPNPMPGWLIGILIGLAALVLAVGAVFLQWILRRYRKQRKLEKGTTNSRVIALYKESRRICRAAHGQLPDRLLTLAEKAGFSQHTLTDEELREAAAAYRSCLKLLQNGTWYRKLIWRFLLALN